MKNALIDPTTQVQSISGWVENPEKTGPKYLPVYIPIDNSARVAEVADASFEVAPPLFWVQCADDVVADQFYYDTVQQQIFPNPEPAPYPGTQGLASV